MPYYPSLGDADGGATDPGGGLIFRIFRTMAGKRRYTPQQVIEALKQTKGMRFLAAQRLGCSHDTITNYINRYASVRDAADAQRGEMVDTAELKLWQSIQNGEAWGITLCLKTLGKERGYVERTEQTGKDGGPITYTPDLSGVTDAFVEEVATLLAQFGASTLPQNGTAPGPAPQ